MRQILISMSIISTSLTVRTQTSPRFHVKSVVTFQELYTHVKTYGKQGGGYEIYNLRGRTKSHTPYYRFK